MRCAKAVTAKESWNTSNHVMDAEAKVLTVQIVEAPASIVSYAHVGAVTDPEYDPIHAFVALAREADSLSLILKVELEVYKRRDWWQHAT